MILETFLPGVHHLQNIHPLVVHFPIAFWAAAALFYGLALGLRNGQLAGTAFSLLILGTISAAIAVGTGLHAEEGVMIARSVREHLFEPHKKVMLSTLGISVVLTAWAVASRPFPKKGRGVFFLILLLLLGMMSVGADFGARMVYDYNAGGNACSQPIEFSR